MKSKDTTEKIWYTDIPREFKQKNSQQSISKYNLAMQEKSFY